MGGEWAVRTLLERIVEARREDVAAMKRRLPREAVEAEAAGAAPARRFREAVLAGKPVGLIAEVKRASPSRGVLRGDFDVEGIARGYATGGAAALSVLTEGRFFQGAPEYVAMAKGACPLPVLRKDFIVDEYQVVESRALGADCVLLIATLLEESRLGDFCRLALSLGMETLVEIHSERELEKISGVPCDIIGVNNRDLTTMEVDIRTSVRLAGLLRGAECRVSESGIGAPEDVRVMKEAGYHGVLVGEALMTAPDPGRKARELLGA
ncbi:MAG: indole-3-glycerol phosphate synthase TrpC [bacterium]